MSNSLLNTTDFYNPSHYLMDRNSAFFIYLCRKYLSLNFSNISTRLCFYKIYKHSFFLYYHYILKNLFSSVVLKSWACSRSPKLQGVVSRAVSKGSITEQSGHCCPGCTTREFLHYAPCVMCLISINIVTELAYLLESLRKPE